jgi:carboxylesterase
VDRGAAILKTCCERIVVAGFSTGAGLALHQALTKPAEFAAVISVSAPLRFKGLPVCFVEVLDAWNRWLRSLGLGRLAREFVVNDADNPHINYARCPVRSLVEVKALMRQVYRRLPSLAVPALILQGDRDPKVAGSSGRRLFGRIASPRKTYREIPFHLHGIVRGEIAQEVFRETEAFLRDLD